jgi:transcriptional regulator with GAF, ATPase, and Fis domain
MFIDFPSIDSSGKVTKGLRDKVSLLEQIHDCEVASDEGLRQKLMLMQEIIFFLANEIESLSFVRSVNISQGIDLHDEMRRFEVHLVQSALERTGGHLTNAAKLLGINLTTLHNKIKRLGISTESIVSAPVIHEDTTATEPPNKGLTLSS